ncbi:hypothetical protein [Streptomyces cellulosae]|uniref:hypothetical protein n=1 Tax=Streptomyces cellulosae TaxID=1968 RepID=UPI00131CAD5A|nr:hypothetical protein [Streptomyces cellulosae]
MRNRVAILAVTSVLPLTAVASLAAASQAAADPQSGEVVVTGSVGDCNSGVSPQSVSIKAGQETITDKNPGVENAGAYSVTFQKIPTAGAPAVATVTCAGDSYTVNFTIKRPTTADDLVQRKNLQE